MWPEWSCCLQRSVPQLHQEWSSHRHLHLQSSNTALAGWTCFTLLFALFVFLSSWHKQYNIALPDTEQVWRTGSVAPQKIHSPSTTCLQLHLWSYYSMAAVVKRMCVAHSADKAVRCAASARDTYATLTCQGVIHGSTYTFAAGKCAMAHQHPKGTCCVLLYASKELHFSTETSVLSSLLVTLDTVAYHKCGRRVL